MLGTSFSLAAYGGCCVAATESNAKGTPSQGAFGADGLGRLFVCMNPRAHEALFRDAVAPSEHGGLCRAVARLEKERGGRGGGAQRGSSAAH